MDDKEPKSFADYVSDRVFEGRRPIASERAERLRERALAKLSDEDHEAYGAMLHAMTPREDRKD
jgi:hypothetical protein